MRLRSRTLGWLAVMLIVVQVLAACDSSTATPTVPPVASATAKAANPAASSTPNVVARATGTAAESAPATNTSVAAATNTTAPLATNTPVVVTVGPTSPAAQPTATTAASGGVQRPILVFAPYPTSYTVNVQPKVAAYQAKTDLSNVQNPAQFKLPAAANTLLAKNNFVVVPPVTADPARYSGLKEFYQVYEAGRYGEEPTFVSSDSILHVYHLIFDKVLRDLESRKLTDELTKLNDAMLRVADAQHTEIAAQNNADLTTASTQLVAYFGVADSLINPKATVPAYVKSKVDAELALIEAHTGLADSNIMAGYTEDYSQYIPRGHYTKSDALKQYFKSMMWLGRMSFRLKEDNETRSAILLTMLLNNQQTLRSGPILDHWRAIYEPTSFLIGKADDLSYFDYLPLVESVYGTAQPSISEVADAGKLADFKVAAKSLPSPMINSMAIFASEDKDEATKGLRMMGQRFTLDAYVIGQLTWRNVGTAPADDQARWLPRSLDVPAAMGSDRALAIVKGEQLDYGQTSGVQGKNYDTQMQKARGAVANLGLADWTQNVYWSWLYTLNALIAPKGEGYPSFMTNEAWTDNQLNTYLGSYTELKHDTILYAKQSMAEMGGGPQDIIKGYVEPQPELYARLAALTEMTRDGLVQRGLLSEQDKMKGSLDSLLNLTSQLKAISEKELSNQPLTDDEYNAILFYGGAIENLTIAAADSEAGEAASYLDQIDAALVADIATGGNDNVRVLEVAIGHPNEIYAVVPIDGKLVLTRGAVFSQYEFTKPSNERMTDEQWQQQLKDGKAPAAPAYTRSFTAPAKLAESASDSPSHQAGGGAVCLL